MFPFHSTHTRALSSARHHRHFLLLSIHVERPLGEHPNDASRRDKQRGREASANFHGAVNQELSGEMGEDDEVGAQGEEVQVRVVDVVGGVESDEGRQETPAAEQS